MIVPFLLNEGQMAQMRPFFLLSHRIPRVDERQIVSGVIFVIKNGLTWRDVPKGYAQLYRCNVPRRLGSELGLAFPTRPLSVKSSAIFSKR